VPGQRDAGFVGALDRIIEARAPVLGDDLLLVELGLTGTGHDDLWSRSPFELVETRRVAQPSCISTHMSDQQEFAMQALVPLATAVLLYVLVPRSPLDLPATGCLSMLIATFIVLVIAISTGVTSTLAIGMTFTAAIAAFVTIGALAVLHGLTRLF
jgi:hypothetical protein